MTAKKRLGARALYQLLRAELDALPEGHERRAGILRDLALMNRNRSKRRTSAVKKIAGADQADRESFRGTGHLYDRDEQFGVDVAIMHLTTNTRHSLVEPLDEFYATASKVLGIACPVKHYDQDRAQRAYENYVPLEETIKMIDSRGRPGVEEYRPKTMRELCAT